MACYHPVKGFRTPHGVVFSELARYEILGEVMLPCGMCIGCRMRRAADWTLRCMHEASLWPENCFVTLTYGRDRLPAGSSLCHEDFQGFLKRLRWHFGAGPLRPIRYFMCGEYGPLNLRPHYHACLFNVDFRSDSVPAGKSGAGAVFYDSPTLAKLWTHGRVSVQPLTRETAGYCARYIMKKQLGPRADAEGDARRPEYAAMSLKPGIGAGWLDKYFSDVYPHDYVVADGTKQPVPKYYDKLLKRIDARQLEDMQAGRVAAASVHVADQTPERLAVREVVHNARVSKLSRSNDL